MHQPRCRPLERAGCRQSCPCMEWSLLQRRAASRAHDGGHASSAVQPSDKIPCWTTLLRRGPGVTPMPMPGPYWVDCALLMPVMGSALLRAHTSRQMQPADCQVHDSLRHKFCLHRVIYRAVHYPCMYMYASVCPKSVLGPWRVYQHLYWCMISIQLSLLSSLKMILIVATV